MARFASRRPFQGRQCVEDDVDAEFCVVFCQEAFVAKVIIPFTAIVFIAIEYTDAAVDYNGL